MLPSVNHPISCGTAASAPTRVFAKAAISDTSFGISVSQVNRITQAGTQSSVVVNDRNVTRSSSASYVTDFLVRPIIAKPQYQKTIAMGTQSPELLSAPNASGLSSYVASGRAILSGTSSDGETVLIPVDAAAASPATVDVFASWVSGSLAEHLRAQVDSRLSGGVLNLYSTYGDGAGQYVRNAACWANGINLTCASPWNSTGGRAMAGTLITPQHVLFCKHYGFYPAVGASIRFVGNAGIAGAPEQVFSTTIASLTTNTGSTYADIAVARLTDPAPAYITPSTFLPANWRNYLPSVPYAASVYDKWLSNQSPLPVLKLDQSDRAAVMEWREVRGPMMLSNATFYLEGATGVRSSYYLPVVDGDSGNPIFAVINNQAVVLGVFTAYFHGPFVTELRPVIEDMIAQLGGGYSLTTVNLTGFPTY